jgi:predicted molibdopterin-dependent oxidoreductase YjgC
VSHPDRLKKPLIRIAPKKRDEKNSSPLLHPSSSFKEVSWDEAYDYIAQRLQEIKDTYGPDAIGGLSSARCTNEENYLFQKFMRAAIRTNNVDHCARY